MLQLLLLLIVPCASHKALYLKIPKLFTKAVNILYFAGLHLEIPKLFTKAVNILYFGGHIRRN